MANNLFFIDGKLYLPLKYRFIMPYFMLECPFRNRNYNSAYESSNNGRRICSSHHFEADWSESGGCCADCAARYPIYEVQPYETSSLRFPGTGIWFE